MTCIVCGDGVGANFIMLGADKLNVVCPKCVIRVREAYRRVVVMGEVCAAVSDALKNHLRADDVMVECAVMLGQAAQCAEIFRRGMKDEEAKGISDDDGTRNVPRVEGTGNQGKEDGEKG